ncbi:sodium/proline symporter PutP [Sansalvadorimonas sp. 2012CJ34-2]|uniref:Sodium/proline symporter n=1 Tax=Parendozoicomonas callyspongiae TaxID=2942213 RepID=A0ABT0PDI6_9GAMM|nr:sodium/proline symporter PutP [Sansalvadorimonas sp. 2012CJ34-2]MCL6269447.1 sodium/proline symporter PutP [Sansalvadorimonas sp. 2012CJ34-2]
MPADTAIMLTFGLYFIVMLVLGIVAWRRTATSEDYFLGGRSLGPWTTALSAGASDMSGWLLLGLPGYAFASGVEAFWLAGGILLGTWLNWQLVATRLRVFSQAAGNALTLPEYFSNRFQDEGRALQSISAAFILLFFLFYTSAGLVAGGKLFETAFGLDYRIAVIVGAISVISYTLFGGFLAVCWTDLVQGLMMAAALVVVPLVVISDNGGLMEVWSSLEAHNPALLNPFTDKDGFPLDTLVILSLVGWGLGYFGQPHILSRFKGIRSEKDMPVARNIAVGWSAICLVAALLVGLAGLVHTLNSGATVNDPEGIFMLLVNSIFHPVVAGILLAAILAAVMSTADSQLLVCSTAFAEDFYKDIFHPEASQERVLWVGRAAVIGISVLACLIALNPESTVLNMVGYAWAGFGAAFGPALLVSLFWDKMSRNGALAGIIVGGLTVVIWEQFSGGIFELYALVPGFILSTLAIFLFSLLDQNDGHKIREYFSRMERLLGTVDETS